MLCYAMLGEATWAIFRSLEAHLSHHPGLANERLARGRAGGGGAAAAWLDGQREVAHVEPLETDLPHEERCSRGRFRPS